MSSDQIDTSSSEASAGSTRPYRKRRRAELEARTRERIVEAAVKLHGTVGPARTTISAIASEAGVQRATVYRHFADEAAIFASCTAHYNALHPPPDPSPWAEIDDPDERLRTAIGALYGYYGEAGQMIEVTSRDAHLVPSMAAVLDGMRLYLDTIRDILLGGRPERGATRRRVAATIGHVISFSTWRSLVREQGLGAAEATAVAERIVGCEAAVSGARSRSSAPR